MDIEKKNQPEQENASAQDQHTGNTHVSTSTSLDDEQRIKVLSPAMLVSKRFFRNKLAMAGLIIIVAMFLFAFVGPFFSPYTESESFFTRETMLKDYASLTVNADLRFVDAPGKTFPAIAKTEMILAINQKKSTFEFQGATYYIHNEGENLYRISQLEAAANVMSKRGLFLFTPAEGVSITPEMETAFEAAVTAKADSFEAGGTAYYIAQNAKGYIIGKPFDVALASSMIYDLVDASQSVSFAFRLAAEKAMATDGVTSFTADGNTYELVNDPKEDIARVYLADGTEKKEFAQISHYVVAPIDSDVFLPVEFKAAAREACAANAASFVFPNQEGVEETYTLVRKNIQFLIKRAEVTRLLNMYSYPSSEHWMGTDANGMDLLTRLMYGGRISLMIGFIVVFLETFIGVVLGGIAGYFGKWIDNLLMRLVDIFNCIPSLPLVIILGGIMDALKIPPQVRIYYLMIILGLLGWPGIARLVRGQILSLREQEFMIAAEATGISVSRRIFRHLVPNVVPQLIVMATMGLGGIILTESTLSFLGLGVKFPFASWGNIMDSVSNVYVMTNYWFIWIPAGFLILMTVLGFNFIGDGLRDAFDPKMKR